MKGARLYGSVPISNPPGNGSINVTSEAINVNVPLSSSNNDISLGAVQLTTNATVNAGSAKFIAAPYSAGAPMGAATLRQLLSHTAGFATSHLAEQPRD